MDIDEIIPAGSKQKKPAPPTAPVQPVKDPIVRYKITGTVNLSVEKTYDPSMMKDGALYQSAIQNVVDQIIRKFNNNPNEFIQISEGQIDT